MQLLFRLPFLLLEMLLRRSAKGLADLVALVRTDDLDDVVAEPSAAPEPPTARAASTPPPPSAPQPAAPTGPPPPTADEALQRRAEREAVEANGAGAPEVASARVRPLEPLEEDRHVDREAEVVESVGPAQDVTATLQVDTPWEGYDAMSATAIVSRLRDADEATRAVVRLYEQQNKNRATVVRATG
jgi:hypothetical protein